MRVGELLETPPDPACDDDVVAEASPFSSEMEFDTVVSTRRGVKCRAMLYFVLVDNPGGAWMCAVLALDQVLM